jgi:predicted transcriptional regulator
VARIRKRQSREVQVLVTVKMPASMVAALDDYAAQTDSDRSKVARKAIRERLGLGGGR